MSVIDYFRHNAEYWVSRINTEGKLSNAEVKLAKNFVTNAFKWDCNSSAERVAKELQNKGYVAYIKDTKERKFRAKLDEVISNRFNICIDYIRTFAPEIIYTNTHVIVCYTSPTGEKFEKKVERQPKITIDFLEKTVKEVKEEAKIWLQEKCNETN